MSEPAATRTDPQPKKNAHPRRLAHAAIEYISALSTMDLATRMTLVLLLVYTPARAEAISIALAAAGLVMPRLQKQGFFWIVIAASRFWLLIPDAWYRIDNHQYLIIYWCVGLGISHLTTDPKATARTTARLLIGLTFLLASLWKVASPDFLNGNFMEFTLISDARFEWFTNFVGGIPAENIQENVEAVRDLRATSGSAADVTLHSSNTVGVVASILSVWTVLIEAAVAVAYLIPRTVLFRYRDVILFIFILTTYPVAPVVGFGWVLVAMAVSQMDSDRTGLKVAYLGLFVALPLLE